MANGKLRKVSMPALHWVLSKRLPLSRTWNNVEVVERKRELVIRWIDPKKPDPEGKQTFCARTIPFSLRSVDAEIERQHEKYEDDKHDM